MTTKASQPNWELSIIQHYFLHSTVKYANCLMAAFPSNLVFASDFNSPHYIKVQYNADEQSPFMSCLAKVLGKVNISFN